MENEQQKALEKIEEIVSDDFCYDIESCLAGMNKPSLTEREKRMAERLSKVYKIAHAYSGHCGNKHNDWKI